jgi:hypothetical protein
MADQSRYGFLIDRDVVKAVSLFPSKRTSTTLEMGLPENASDAEIVKLACERQRIIVTANGDDFIREIRRYLKTTEKKECHDLSGLVILPNRYECQRRVLDGIGNRLYFDGKKITWNDVWKNNYCVRILRYGKVVISELPKCFYCQKLRDQ